MFGILLVALPGSARILQLRLRDRRRRRIAAREGAAMTGGDPAPVPASRTTPEAALIAGEEPSSETGPTEPVLTESSPTEPAPLTPAVPPTSRPATAAQPPSAGQAPAAGETPTDLDRPR